MVEIFHKALKSSWKKKCGEILTHVPGELCVLKIKNTNLIPN